MFLCGWTGDGFDFTYKLFCVDVISCVITQDLLLFKKKQKKNSISRLDKVNISLSNKSNQQINEQI